MTLSNNEKINFIKNNFHQYFDLTLKTPSNITTTETVNLVIPIDSLTDEETFEKPSYYHNTIYPEGYNVNEILDKYEDTEYDTDLKKCFCTNVVDGDTIDVDIPYMEDDSDEIKHKQERVRLVGVNTPEFGKNGYDVSKEFLEKVCLNNELYLKIDKEKNYDYYKRLLCVVIYKNKNINEVLLKENLAEIWFIPPSEFNPYSWGTETTDRHVYEQAAGTIKDINVLYPYFNSDMTNIVFTPQDDITKIYRFEIYKGVIYIRMNPFSQYIRMHLLPKGYDCSNSVLIFRDEMLTKENINKSDDYFYYENGSPINSYFLTNNEVRDRTNPDISSDTYNGNNWQNTYCEFSYDISKSTRSFKNLQICAGYRYNNSAPYYSIHFTGVRDNTNIVIEDRCTLVDANFDEIENISNNITQHKYNNQNQIYLPKNPMLIRGHYEDDIDHVHDIQKVHHKIVKYINDTMYSEEDCFYSEKPESSYDPSVNNKRYTVCNWVDLSEEN